MDNYFGWKVCRVCMIPSSVEESSRLHGELAKTFEDVTGFDFSGVDEAEICGKCRKVVESCYELMEEVKAYEEHVFEPMRSEYDAIQNDPADRNLEIDIDFEACRACLMPISEGPLESAMKCRGRLAKMLEAVTGVDLTTEGKIHHVLICSPCAKTLQRAVHLKFVVTQSNDHYFAKFKARQCAHCKKLFSRVDHIRRHLENGSCNGKSDVSLRASKNFLCWCKKSFANKSDLKAHKLTCTSFN